MTQTSALNQISLITTDSHDCRSVSSKRAGLFLINYAARLLGCGATCIRLDKNVQRMASRWGKHVELTIMPRHVHLTVWDIADPDDRFTTTSVLVQNAISYNLNTRLSALSWDVADGKVDFDGCVTEFDRIVGSDSHNYWILLLLVAVAAASFCRLFGGDLWSMACVGVAACVGFSLKQFLLSWHWDIRGVVIICAFVSGVIGGTCSLFSLGDTPVIAEGTSVLYLIPGIPFLNSFSDMLYRHYICAFSRFIDAMVLTGCLSFGLCLSMLLMRVHFI